MSSSMRIGGLASGMDTEQIISDLMSAQRVKVDRLEQDRQILEWQQEFYREINNKLRAFRDACFDMKLQGTYLTKKASSAGETVLTAKAGGAAVEGVYDVAVEQLAKGVFTSSAGDIAEYKDTLKEQFFITDPLTFSITNSAVKDEDGNVIKAEFTIDPNENSLQDLVNEINSWKNEDGVGLGIKASYDKELNRFFLQTTSTGAQQSITVDSAEEEVKRFFYNDLKMTELFQDDAGILTAQTLTGQNAKVTFNGSDFEFSSNNVTISGITMNLKAPSSRDGDGNLVSTAVTVSKDTDAVFDSIVKFIDTYNETITAVEDKLYEKRYSDYLPLTDEQREELTEKQEEKWEEKARSGLLRNDSILSTVVSKMRMTMSAAVSGDTGENPIDCLADLGIKTTVNYMSGELVIEDEDKLRQAIEDDLEAVINLFTKSSDTYEEMGIAQRLYSDADSGIDLLIDKAGSSDSYSDVDDSFIGKRIKSIDEDIERWEDRLEQIEDRYWNQFTVMEQYISQMNQQSMWLAQQFSSY